MKNFVFLLLPFLCACASAGHDIHDVAPVGSYTIVFVDPHDFDQGARADVVEAVERHLGAWSAEFGRDLEPTTIEVFDVDEFLVGDVMAIGRVTPDGRIQVVRGERDSLPALFHECCHRGRASSFFGEDSAHESAAWPGWTARSYEIAQKLVDERSLW